MHEFWYDYHQPKYADKAKPCDIDTDSFIVQIKTNYICKEIVEGVEKGLTHQIMNQIDHCLKERKNG